MSNYDDLGQAIRTLKRAAIDAYMRDQGWDVGDDEYTFQPPVAGTSFGYNYFTVSRPDANGHGGGDERIHNLYNDLFGSYGSDHREFVPEFNEIRSGIDAAMAPLLGMPNPDGLTHMLEVCQDAEAGFWLDAELGVGGTTLREAMTSAKGNMTLVNGAFPAAFEANFLNQLPGTVGALRELAIVRYTAMVQEHELWNLARENACQLVANATAAFGKVVNPSGDAVKLALTIAGYAAAAGAIIVSGGSAAAGVVGAISLGITILKETAVTDDESDEVGRSFEEVMGAFVAMTTRLVNNVTMAESEIRQNVVDNIAGVHANMSTYEISNNGLPSASDYDQVTVDVAAAKEIIGSYLPDIAEHVRAVVTSNGRMYPSSALGRTSGLGCGPHGPGPELAEISTLLYDLGEKLAVETTRANKALGQWIDDIHGFEESVVQQIADFLAQLDAPTSYDP